MAAPVATGDSTAEPSATVRLQPPPHHDMAQILPSLPLESQCPPFRLRHYSGFWLPEDVLMRLPSIHSRMKPRPGDVFLTSFPKSGTTWLKALAFATLNRAKHSPFDRDHPLRRHSPHECVKFMEMDELEEPGSSSPHVLSTHLPYSLLPKSITGEGSGSKIVYICRNPKDVLVSNWVFFKKVASAFGQVDAQQFTLHEAFEKFCEGRSFGGPQWKHVLRYWEESLRRPEMVLFLQYEDMLRQPASNLRKLAKFMGCEVSKEEEDGRVVDALVKLCSLHEMKNVEVNRHGRNRAGFENAAFFRQGAIRDWSNHITPDMAIELDRIVDDALQGSGFEFMD
ncbi:unnamed protein product [Urochloa decumbens]|uniref:Sulfotransferase n=1 Tax=Urochloa decumbens TaxID=240449 RepID=A0ABC9AMU2_9POAL